MNNSNFKKYDFIPELTKLGFKDLKYISEDASNDVYANSEVIIKCYTNPPNSSAASVDEIKKLIKELSSFYPNVPTIVDSLTINKTKVHVMNKIPSAYYHPQEKTNIISIIKEAKILHSHLSNLLNPLNKHIIGNSIERNHHLDFIKPKLDNNVMQDYVFIKNHIDKLINKYKPNKNNHKLLHGDLTSGNILIRKENIRQDLPRIFFIDFDGIHYGDYAKIIMFSDSLDDTAFIVNELGLNIDKILYQMCCLTYYNVTRTNCYADNKGGKWINQAIKAEERMHKIAGLVKENS